MFEASLCLHRLSSIKNTGYQEHVVLVCCQEYPRCNSVVLFEVFRTGEDGLETLFGCR